MPEADDEPLEVRLDWPTEPVVGSGVGAPRPGGRGGVDVSSRPPVVSRSGEAAREAGVPAVDDLRGRVDALSHASLAMHGVVVDRLSRQGEQLGDLSSDVRDALRLLETLPSAVAGLQAEQLRLGAVLDRLAGEGRQAAAPKPGTRLDAWVTGLVRGWDRFRELRRRRPA